MVLLPIASESPGPISYRCPLVIMISNGTNGSAECMRSISSMIDISSCSATRPPRSFRLVWIFLRQRIGESIVQFRERIRIRLLHCLVDLLLNLLLHLLELFLRDQAAFAEAHLIHRDRVALLGFVHLVARAVLQR